MNFDYIGRNSSELIKNFQISKDIIIINYLDKSIEIIPFTDEKEQELLSKMLNQAEERNNNFSLNEANFSRNRLVTFLIINILLTIFFIDKSQTYEYPKYRSFFVWVSSFVGLMVVISGTEYIFKRSEINELKKYALYLQIREKFEENKNDYHLFVGIKEHKEELNINTLDLYSLKEIKQIKANLDSLSNDNQHLKRRKK